MVLPVTPEVNYTFSVSLATVLRVELLSRLGRSNRGWWGHVTPTFVPSPTVELFLARR